MRQFNLAALAAVAAASAVIAAPAFAATTVDVTVGPELQKKAVNSYGVREVDELAADLRATVERRLARTGALDGARVELVLVDAKPNRPTFKQLGDTVGLSMRSFSLGGAKIEGRAVAADGSVTPLSYGYYDTDLQQAAHRSTWGEAQSVFERFAFRLSRGQLMASR